MKKTIKIIIAVVAIFQLIVVSAFATTVSGNLTTSSKSLNYDNNQWLTKLNIQGTTAWGGTYANTGTAKYVDVTLYNDALYSYGRKDNTYTNSATTIGINGSRFDAWHEVEATSGARYYYITGTYSGTGSYSGY